MNSIIGAFGVAIVLASALSAQAPGQPAGQGRGGRGQPPDPRSAGGGQCAANPYNCIDTANPLRPPDTVWLEEMTWMDVRDAMKAGKTTIIISTGGIEPNGPWLALGKHNFVLKANCDAIARKLGDALCAPIDPFVPEGDPSGKSGHMATVGTISLREETFRLLLTDMVTTKDYKEPLRFTSAMSNGSDLYAFRYAANDNANTLYYQESGGNVVVVSEPLDGERAHWKPVPPGHAIVAKAGKPVSLEQTYYGVRNYLNTVYPEHYQYQRFFSLAHLHNDLKGVKDDDLGAGGLLVALGIALAQR